MTPPNKDYNGPETLENEDLIDDISGEDLIEETAFSKELQPLKHSMPTNLTVLPVFQKPVFPGIPTPLTFSGDATLEAIKEAIEKNQGYVGVVLAGETDTPGELEYQHTGTAFQILRVAPVAPKIIQVVGQGITRFTKKKVLYVQPHIKWEVEYHPDENIPVTPELKAYMLSIGSELKSLLQLNPIFKEQLNMVVSQLNYEEPGLTMDIISSLLTASSEKLQD